jgi:hypothetical protein
VSATREQRRSVGLPGIGLVLVGAAVVLLSFRFLDWYDVAGTGADSVGDVTFSTLHSSAEQLGGAGVASAYFSWLAWALLIAMIVLGAAANLPVPGADALRVAGFLVGVLGVAGTYYALAQHSNSTGGSGVFHNSTWGVWLALLGYLLGAVGATLGPRKAKP